MMNNSNQDPVFMEFITKFDRMRDYPERETIRDLTELTKSRIMNAFQFATFIVSRLVHPNTNTSFKLPMFYLIDSIMKNVGGPYAAFFSKLLSDTYTIAFHNLHEKDCNRLTFLLTTWEERKFFPDDLLLEMKATLNPGQSNVTNIDKQSISYNNLMTNMNFGMNLNNNSIPMNLNNSLPTNPFEFIPPAFSPIDTIQNYSESSTTQLNNNATDDYPNPMNEYVNPDLALPNDGIDRTSATYIDLVKNEMISLLNQMYTELGVDNPLTLDELAECNPSLFTQIGLAANEKAIELLLKRKGMYQNRSSISTTTSRMNPSHSKFSDEIPIIPTTVLSNTVSKRPMMSDGPSTFDHTITMQDKRQRVSQSNKNSSNNHPRKINDMSNMLFNPNVPPFSSNSTTATASTTTTTTVTVDDDTMDESILPPHYVNAYICEVPVVIDVNRAKELVESIGENRSMITNQVEWLGDFTESAWESLCNASNIVFNRLDVLIQNVRIPPSLHQILFGPLPLEPIHKIQQKSSRFQPSNVIPSLETLPLQPIKKKSLGPEFRMEELGRNPEVMVKALYTDRPYQYHEDGLRFSTLTKLKEHTDAYLEKKKLVLKKKKESNREYREWYCTIQQWVTDFNSLGRKGSLSTSDPVVNPLGSSSTSHGQNISGSTGLMINMTGNKSNPMMNVEVEFIVPADENFTRCPISKEIFESIWDEDEGEFMYRNAVKVLVSEAADSSLYQMGKETDEESIRYLIVHKLLVLDRWLSVGTAVPLRDAIERYKMLGSHGMVKIEKLNAAAGIEESEDDVFVILELA